jgi:hypothetical protein
MQWNNSDRRGESRLCDKIEEGEGREEWGIAK